MKRIKLLIALFAGVAVLFSCSVLRKPTLLDTHWMITYNDGHRSHKFELIFNTAKTSGKRKLTHMHPADKTPDNDFWKQKGDSVILFINDNYVIFRGRITEPGMMKGTATNSVNNKWEWEARKNP